MMNRKECGVIYCATDIKYLDQARASVASLRNFNSDIKCSIITNLNVDKKNWDQVIELYNDNNSRLNMMHKLNALLLTPYNKTIYLDSDTYILGSIDDLFILLDKFDLLLTHGHNRKKRFDIFSGNLYWTNYKPPGKSLPYSFAPIQGGLLAYNFNENIKGWLIKLKEKFIEKDFFDDQYSIRELLWESNLRFYILPPEYNFNSIDDLKRWKKNHYREAIPKIFHYTKYKGKDIPKITSKYYSIKKNDWQKLDLKLYWLPKRIRNALKLFHETLKKRYNENRQDF